MIHILITVIAVCFFMKGMAVFSERDKQFEEQKQRDKQRRHQELLDQIQASRWP